MKRHALFVGVDQYADGHIPNLSCAVSDATDLHGFFKFGAGYDRVELLQNPAGKKEVLGAVRELTADLTGGDFFLLFFAGHGFRVGENHVLVCANDLYEDVKYEDDGLPLGQLKRRLSGAFDSALLLDACQSDILATRGGEGIAERDLSLIHETTTDKTCGGALTIVTSCDAGQTAAELSEARHGLFTMAMLDLLKEAQCAHTRLDLSDAFKMSLGRRMREIAARSGLSTDQRPRFSCPGEVCFTLLEGAVATPMSEVILPPSAPFESVLSPCPICGRNNAPTNTFNCVVCGTKNLCISHFSAEYNRCEACAQKIINTKKALSAYNENDWDLAYELMQNGDASDPEGQYVLGCLYELGGRYIDEDADKAFELFGKAAEQGYAEAQFKLADYYKVGCCVAENPSEAYKWFMKAARQGHIEAQDFVGWCYETGFGVEEDPDSAYVWYLRSAEQGWAAAQCALGRLYATGEGVEEDAEESVKWFRKAADQGYADAQYELGECYYNGVGVEQSEEEAIKWYRLSADKGNDNAQERLDELETNEEDGGKEQNEEAQKSDWQTLNPAKTVNIGSAKKTVSYMLTAFRDGFSCVMGARVLSKHFLPAVEAAYDAGVRWFEMGGGASFQTSFFHCQENAFDVMDSFRRLCPDAELQTLSRGNNIVGLESQSTDVIRLYAKMFKKHGVDAIRNYDAFYDPNNLKISAQSIHDAGMRHEVAVGIMRVPSGAHVGNAHTPEFYVERLRIFLESGMPIDRVCFKDNSGTTPPSVIYDTICQARRLLGNGVHIQFHTHDSLGLGNESCMAALKGGADGLDLSFSPLSGGTCQPDLISMYQALRGSNEFAFDFNCEKMSVAVKEFQELTRKYYLPHEALATNQMLENIPVSNGSLAVTMMQLADAHVEQPYEKMIPEFAECFRRGGCAAASMTPVGQFYLQQAAMNILNPPFVRFAPGYAKMLLGYFGKLPVAPDPMVVKAATLALAADPATKVYAYPTSKTVIDLNDADPNKGIGPARRKLQENGLPITDENVLIAATCKDKGIQFLKGNAVLGCRFADYESNRA